MKLGRLTWGLALLTCAVPGYFFLGSYVESHGIDTGRTAYQTLAVWLIAALYLYHSAVYTAIAPREALKFLVYRAAVFGLLMLGVFVSYWGLIVLHGE